MTAGEHFDQRGFVASARHLRQPLLRAVLDGERSFVLCGRDVPAPSVQLGHRDQRHILVVLASRQRNQISRVVLWHFVDLQHEELPVQRREAVDEPRGEQE
eukprot:CAMPEP_0195651388 /NCGR_PEP_ID=MMETSP0815-20121206/32242_1 /TAXON_ID=97485 /ORGANISM="Prymnesium parvum, Strain Texoma1" /LENGTH=100 /DNA_ID=CAMNT_0040795293 /DNA_START=30 /DNA_END=329 /DNA_ORIENTATION=-